MTPLALIRVIIPEAAVKLSAPPPPPPEPNEQPAPEPTPPDQTADTPDAPAPAKPASKPAMWPGWFGGADAALALLAVVLAFLVASFAARNTDLWLHLGAGKMLTTGEYKLGSDPFSYSAADRTWVNHSWLFDLGMYLLYSGTGFTLVLLKALAVAVAAALLLSIRRPSYPLWPWAVCVVLFVLASAPRLTLAPIVGSVLFFAALLFMVFKLPAKRLPVAVGVVFWVWANVDQWFFIGPLALAVLLLGEFAQQKFLKKPDEAAEEPLNALPPVPTLAKALAIGVVVCMLNPHHVRVWELPFELVGSKVGKADREIAIGWLVAPIDGVYSERADLGYNVNGLSYALLLVLGGVSLGFGVGRLRVSHLLLWVAFAAMSLVTVFAIPFFAAVAVPLIAAQLNALSARVKLGSRSSPGTRLVVVGSAGGRVVSLVGLLALCAFAWPGWLHPQPFEPAAARRVAWAVEPDPAVSKAATQFKAWREKGELPPDARGMIVTIQLANYCAWFAPGEKVFINGRFKHHRAELPDYLALRLALGLRTRDGPPDPSEAGAIMAKNKAEYVGYYDPIRRIGPVITFTLWAASENWVSWYTDGRTAVFGWRESPGRWAPQFEKLRLDAVALAIGPDAVRLPAGKVQPLPRPREWEDDFTRPLKQPPPEIDEAFGWLAYRESRAMAYNAQQQVGGSMFVNTPATQGDSFHQFGVRYLAETGQIGSAPPRGDAFAMAPVMALRAARRAIAANPDHPDCYYVLALALQDPALPMSETERKVALITAYRQCLSRLPTPDELRKQFQTYNRRLSIASPREIAFTLVQQHLNLTNQGQIRGLILDEDPLRSLAGAPLQNQQRQVVAFRFLPFDLVRTLLVQTADYAELEP
ncbi:MAG TPA: hypothetical protein VMZ71_01995, partial [Gemmataceae bacterium]|nr:hypothetical protein [Gemmataceae bacterium]